MSEAAKPRSSDGPTIAPMVAAIGETVRSIRRERTLTLEQLAEASGLSAGVISQLERGIGNPAFATLVQLAHALDVPVGGSCCASRTTSRQSSARRNAVGWAGTAWRPPRPPTNCSRPTCPALSKRPG
ncbi:helix-turn-helix domain-containing protein [Streptomyces chiangmaiensis]